MREEGRAVWYDGLDRVLHEKLAWHQTSLVKRPEGLLFFRAQAHCASPMATEPSPACS